MPLVHVLQSVWAEGTSWNSESHRAHAYSQVFVQEIDQVLAEGLGVEGLSRGQPVDAIDDPVLVGHPPLERFGDQPVGIRVLQIADLAKDRFPEKDLPVLTYPLPKTEKGEKRDIVTGDLDGDSILDVVVTDPERAEFLLYRGDREVGLQGPEYFPGFKDMRKLCIGDLQGKGHDAVIALSVDEKLIGISQLQKGRLSFPKIVDIEGKPQAMEVADLNGDGKLDLAYISQEKKRTG